MRRLGRILGWLLVIAALVVVGVDALDALRGGAFDPRPAGQLWYDLHSASLNVSQAAIQRYVHPALWDPVISTILLFPAFVVLGVPGLLLLWLTRPRRRAIFG